MHELTAGSRRGANRRTRRATAAILPSIAAAAGTKLPPLTPLARLPRSRRLSIPRLVIDLPLELTTTVPESFEDVTSELSRLIERPRRHTTPPPIPRPTPVPMRARTQTQPSLVGDWQLGCELGRGGMGAVYAVTHREFGKRAALKLSHTPLDGTSLGAKVFLREARVVQLIDHPSMPDVFATGTHEDRPYLVMERLRGETLIQLIERGALDRRRAIDVLIDLCDVLAVAHEAGVIHRDLKPDNVFVLEQAHPLGTRTKLLDWGFAHLLGEDDPFHGMIAGTLSYVAPEQVLGAPITPATDLYSLGVLTYLCLLGQSPFAGTTGVDLARRHLHAAPPDPALLWRDIPKPLAQLLIAMLAKEPLCRPTLEEVRATLVATRTRRRLFTLRQGIEPLARPSVAPILRRTLGAATAIACAIAGAAAMLLS
ncbi:MAG: serine/threonine protein kinase [Deltaproteobacteria bacterium]|nr:serine/threonine protein kinase [Deltaproteobacteria bacterium]